MKRCVFGLSLGVGYVTTRSMMIFHGENRLFLKSEKS